VDDLLDLIRRFEGCRLAAYYCPAGVLTIGYGHTGPDVLPDSLWTRQEAEKVLQIDARRFFVGASRLCPALSGPALCAISDFAYNLGLARLAGSTLRRKINAGDMIGAGVELNKWVRAGGRVLPGLVARRRAESDLLRL